jgi:hypothetical protein
MTCKDKKPNTHNVAHKRIGWVVCVRGYLVWRVDSFIYKQRDPPQRCFALVKVFSALKHKLAQQHTALFVQRTDTHMSDRLILRTNSNPYKMTDWKALYLDHCVYLPAVRTSCSYR